MLSIMAFLLTVFSVSPDDADVVWLQTDWPPHQIIDGSAAGEGTFDLLQQRIVAMLPTYRHTVKLSSLARVETYFLDTRSTTCTIGTLYSADRARTRHYSLPVAVGSGMAISYSPDSMVALFVDEQHHIDLRKLVYHPELLGAYQPHRYYPSVVFDIISDGRATLLATAFTSELNAVALLQQQRVDYVIEYPERIQFYQRALAQQATIVSSPIRDVSPFAVSHVTCNKTATAEHLIAEIDKLLPVLWQEASHQELIFRWLDQHAVTKIMPKYLEIRQQMVEKNRP